MKPKEKFKQILADIVLIGPTREDVYLSSKGKEFISGLSGDTLYESFLSTFGNTTSKERKAMIEEMYCVRNAIFHASILYLTDDGVLYIKGGDIICSKPDEPHTKRFHGDVRVTLLELEGIVNRFSGFHYSWFIENWKKTIRNTLKEVFDKLYREKNILLPEKEDEGIFSNVCRRFLGNELKGVTFRSVSIEENTNVKVDKQCGPLGSKIVIPSSKLVKEKGYNHALNELGKTYIPREKPKWVDDDKEKAYKKFVDKIERIVYEENNNVNQ